VEVSVKRGLWNLARIHQAPSSYLIVDATSFAASALAICKAIMAYTIDVNGISHSADADGDTPLLWGLHDTLEIAGPKFGRPRCAAPAPYMSTAQRRNPAFPHREHRRKRHGLLPPASHQLVRCSKLAN